MNEAWAQAARVDGEAGAPARVGDSYLEVCRAAVEPRASRMRRAVLRGLAAVVGQRRSRLLHRVPHRAPRRGERWLELLAEPLRRAEGGAVVTLVDITDRKRAELEAGRLRDDLAHLTRVSTLGELAASLAHELNQPLTAILSNVQAAQILMSRPSPDLDEVREILAEVATDDKRAGEVIRRLSALFKKGQRERVPLDVNELIREVLRLLHNDIALRGASLRAGPRARPSPRRGGSHPAPAGRPEPGRQRPRCDARPAAPAGVISRSARACDQTTMRIEVADTGRGIDEADRERLFEPFYTTKPTGMGMGLAIARSIVEAHGGSLSVASHAGPGAIFHVTFPTTAARSASAH